MAKLTKSQEAEISRRKLYRSNLRKLAYLNEQFKSKYADDYLQSWRSQDELDSFYRDVDEQQRIAQALQDYHTASSPEYESFSKLSTGYRDLLADRKAVSDLYGGFKNLNEWKSVVAKNEASKAEEARLDNLDINEISAQSQDLGEKITSLVQKRNRKQREGVLTQDERKQYDDQIKLYQNQKKKIDADIEKINKRMRLGELEAVKNSEGFDTASAFDDSVQSSTYRIINGLTGSDANIDRGYRIDDDGWHYDLGQSNEDQIFAENMTDDEKKIYNALRYEDPAKAQEYLALLDPVIAMRASEKAYRYGKEHPFLGTIDSILSNATGAAQQFGSIVKFEDVGYNQSANLSSSLREGVSSDMTPLGSFLYNTGISGAESLVASLVPYAGEAMLALSAAANAQNDILRRGGSDSQALVGGFASGIAEAFFEHFSLGTLRSMDTKAIVSSFKDFISNIGKEVLVNASEEAATELTNILSDTFIMGEISTINTAIDRYIASGMSESDAYLKATMDIAMQIGEAAASGALMGFGFSALGSTVGVGQNYSAGSRIMKDQVKYGELLQMGSDLSTDKDNTDIASTIKLYEKTNKKQQSKSPAQKVRVGALAYSMSQEEVQKALKAINEKSKANIPQTVTTAENAAKTANVSTADADIRKSNAPKIVSAEGQELSKIFVEKDGQAVSLDKLSIEDSDLAMAYSYAVTTGSVESANEFISAYTLSGDNTAPTAFWSSWMGIMASGQTLSTTDENMQKVFAEYGDTLSDSAKLSAWLSGVTSKQKASERRIKAAEQARELWEKDGRKVTRGSIDASALQGVDLDSKQREFVAFGRLFAESLGMNVKFVASKKGDRGDNGSYNRKTNTITLDVFAGIGNDANYNAVQSALANTLSHEVVHNMRIVAPKEYDALSDYVFDTLKAQGVDIEERIQYQIAQSKDKKLSREDAIEEIVAHACDGMLKTSETVREFMEGFYAKDRSAARRFEQKVREILKKLKEVFDTLLGTKAYSEEARTLYKAGSERVAEIQKLFDKGVLAMREGNLARNAVKAANVNIDGNTDGKTMFMERETTEKINQSMTMAEAKRMIETAYKVNNIAEYYEGEYANAEDWLKKAGASEVELYIKNDYDLQAKYINSNEDILNEEYSISDVLEAYLAGTLVGKEKPKPKRLDVSQSTKLQDTRFYSPQKIENAKETFELAKQKAVGEKANAINRARAEILLFAHNKGAAELLGLTQSELNKKLRSWSNYSATAKSISERINAGVAEENRWTGIENSSYVNKAKVTNEDIERLVESVEGDSKGYERKYIARVMLAVDTHIDYSGLKFKFASSQQVNADHGRGDRVLGFYDDTNRLIEVNHDKPNTVAHEMGHYIDAQWGRDLVRSTTSTHLFLTNGVNADIVREIYGEAGVQFLNNFKLFINSLSDVNTTYNSYYNDRKEIFARFFARFVEWTDNIATGNKYYSYESTMYGDKFTQAQYVEFARLLQEKALLDGSVASIETSANSIISSKTEIMREIKDTRNGGSVVWIEDDVLKGNKLPTHQAVANYLAQHIGDVYTIIESGQKVYLGKDLPSEYTQSEYTKALLRKPGLLKAKNKALPNLGEMIEIATNRRWSKDKGSGKKDAKYGVYKYNTRFAFPVLDSKGNKVRAKAFDATLVIINSSDGKKYLYDVISIKENTSVSVELSERESIPARKQVQKESVSANSIPQNQQMSSTFEKNSSDELSQQRIETPDPSTLLKDVIRNKIGAKEYGKYTESLKKYQDLDVRVRNQEKRISEIDAEIKALKHDTKQSGKGTRMDELYRMRKTAEGKVTEYRNRMFALESKELSGIVRAETEKARQTVQREARERYHKSVVSRHNTERRNRLRKIVNELNTLFAKGNKKKNVKSGLSDTVEKALKLSQVLVYADIGNEEVILAGLMTSQTDAEQKVIDKYKAAIEEKERLDAELDELREQEGSDNEAKVKELRNKINKINAEKREYANTLRDLLEREKRILSKMKIGSIVDELAKAYSDLQNAEESFIRQAYSEVTENRIKKLAQDFETVYLKDMTENQLDEIVEVYKAVLKTVKEANKAFISEKGETYTMLAENTMAEIRQRGKAKDKENLLSPIARKFMLSNAIPVWFFDNLRSNTLIRLFTNLANAEDDWAVIIKDALQYKRAIDNKYDVKKWDLDKTFSFTLRSGKKVEITLSHLFSIYAWAKQGDEAKNHLFNGGFVYAKSIILKDATKKRKKFIVRPGSTFRLDETVLAEMFATMEKAAPGASKYIDEMVAYLSGDLAQKGNDTAVKLYGIRIFNKTYYFPIISSADFIRSKEQKSAGESPRIKNWGATNARMPGANNPIVLNSFEDIWAKHVVQMASFATLTLPLEDMERVITYSTRADDKNDAEYVKGAISTVLGGEYVEYIDRLIDDLNGGARVDDVTGFMNTFMRLAKTGATAMSMSTLVQQPTSMFRAMAFIDPKYFVLSRAKLRGHKEEWAELQKYAPVAIIKEMGGYDTGLGAKTAQYLKSPEYDTLGEKAIALIKDSSYRNEVIFKAPALADEITWCYIWAAVKKEVAATNKALQVDSEAYYKACGERFEYVIRRTQVYDSVLARSPIMRSKNPAAKMVTSFASEPTVFINMGYGAVDAVQRKEIKTATRILVSSLASIITNAIVSSFVYAARDDDEDETYIEKYIQSFNTEMIEGLNPITYIPFLRDIWSIMLGYDIERLDVSVIVDVWHAFEGIFSSRKTPLEKISTFLGKLSTIFGVPLNNLIREGKATINLFRLMVEYFENGELADAEGILDALQESGKDSIPLLDKFI